MIAAFLNALSVLKRASAIEFNDPWLPVVRRQVILNQQPLLGGFRHHDDFA
jgi:hypothetical protein